MPSPRLIRRLITSVISRTPTPPIRVRISPLGGFIGQLEDRVVPAILTVNSLLDNTTAGDGLVTLREAIAAANDDTTTDLGQTGAGADSITFDPALFTGGAQKIDLSLVGDTSVGSSATRASARLHSPSPARSQLPVPAVPTDSP